MLENLTIREQSEILEREKFGWKSAGTKTERSGFGRTSSFHTAYVLVRETTMPNYGVIKSLEGKYFALKSTKKRYYGADIGTALLLFLLFIIPGIVYLMIKNMQKRNIDDYNFEVEKKMKSVLEELKKYK